MSASEILQRLNRQVRIVLHRVSHPGNIGAAARAMKTMGLGRLYLVAPRYFPHEEANARAVGAVDILNASVVCSDLDEALTGVARTYALSARRRDLGPAVQEARQAAAEIITVLSAANENDEIALVFGNEANGLSNADVQRCGRIIEIPANPEFTSLNLGAAVQLLCYELRQTAGIQENTDRCRVTPFFSEPATHDEIEKFYLHLERIMTASGFYDPDQPRRLMAKLRRLFGRAGLERDEVNILRGILSSIENNMAEHDKS